MHYFKTIKLKKAMANNGVMSEQRTFQFGDVNLANRFRLVKPKRKLVEFVRRNFVLSTGGAYSYEFDNLNSENSFSYNFYIRKDALVATGGLQRFEVSAAEDSFFSWMFEGTEIYVYPMMNGGVLSSSPFPFDYVDSVDGGKAFTLDVDAIIDYFSANSYVDSICITLANVRSVDTYISLDKDSVILGKELPVDKDLFTLDERFLNLVSSPVLDMNNIYVQAGNYLVDPKEVYYLLEKVGGQ